MNTITVPSITPGVPPITLPVVPVTLPINTQGFPNLPAQAAQAAVSAVSKVAAHYSSQAAIAVANVLAAFGPQVAPQAVASLQAFLARQGVSGLSMSGLGVYDPNSIDWASVINGASSGTTSTVIAVYPATGAPVAMTSSTPTPVTSASSGGISITMLLVVGAAAFFMLRK